MVALIYFSLTIFALVVYDSCTYVKFYVETKWVGLKQTNYYLYNLIIFLLCIIPIIQESFILACIVGERILRDK